VIITLVVATLPVKENNYSVSVATEVLVKTFSSCTYEIGTTVTANLLYAVHIVASSTCIFYGRIFICVPDTERLQDTLSIIVTVPYI